MEQSGSILEYLKAIDNADAHQSFIRYQWREFAAFAWQHYNVEGRGAIIIDLMLALRKGSKSTIPTYYVAEGSELLKKRGGWPNEEIADVIRNYDPEEEIVFVVAGLNGEFSYYNASDELTPRQAFESAVNLN